MPAPVISARFLNLLSESVKNGLPQCDSPVMLIYPYFTVKNFVTR